MRKTRIETRPYRTVRFPLKLKLLTVMIVLIASSLTIFVGIALKIFKEDKSAYIYETLLNKASSGQLILSHKLLSAFPSATNAAFNIKQGKLFFGDNDPSDILKQETSSESSFKLGIIIPMQNEYYRFEKQKLVKVSENEKKVFSSIFENSINQAAKEIELDGEKWLFAFDYNPTQHFIYTAAIPQEKAFAATTFLIERSVQYGLFILGAAMLLSVLLARPLTSQLELLFGMTQEIAKGNFDNRVNVTGHDEVGALSDSVNDMADKIVLYMEEMKEKARLENEVEVAKLVQSSFFPKSSVNDSNLKVYGHFEPASECGGDWWGMLDHNEWRVFFIADATGHGVPAALLTATINCCKSSLGFMLETKPDLLSRPEEILRYMNHAVHSAGKEIQVTCFVASFNRKTHEFIYTNSSHPAPLLFAPVEGKLEKDCFNPLIEANGPRLGQHPESTFIAHRLILKNHDTIFFYTDGLPEAEDPEGARWGERRMIKSLIANGTGTPQEIIDGVFGDLKVFMADKPKNDDLTAVALKVIS
ncbi:MAG TPA: SpoIIE family protein phosphatase [Bacteriovoracaceae bacterium]|nr:SpoIIE family protein phosphatase [Bacteriovoracaceae bacterium]